MSYINNFINLNNVNNVINRENNYNYYRNNVNYWNEIIYRIHEMNVDEMIVPVHNRDYLLGVIEAAASESSSACARASVLETPVEIFKRLDISVTKADDKVQAQVQEEKKKDCCSVCKEDYVDGDEVVITGCNHLFHACCLATWVKTKQTCPNCRESVVNLFL
jgi:hypothetical protein